AVPAVAPAKPRDAHGCVLGRGRRLNRRGRRDDAAPSAGGRSEASADVATPGRDRLRRNHSDCARSNRHVSPLCAFCRSATCQRRHDAKTWYETQTLFASIAAKHSPCTLIASPRNEASPRYEPSLHDDPIVKIIRAPLAADRHHFSSVCPCL